MALQCFEWIAHVIGLFPCFTNLGVVKQLPDDLIVDILSRLTAERVLEYRRVCKRWRSLTSSQYFINLHLSRATTPTILIHSLSNRRKGEKELGFFVYDPTIKPKKMNELRFRPEFTTIPTLTGLFDSCCGLVLFTHWFSAEICYVFNPVTQERFSTIPCPSSESHPPLGRVCGFFYHPQAKKYQILYRGFVYGRMDYYMYTFGSHVWRFIESPSFHSRPSHDSPAVYNGALYWIADCKYDNYDEIPPCTCGVLVFDVIKEKFQAMPHPGDECQNRQEHEHMSLLVGTERLYFYYVRYYAKLIDVWTLKDHSTCEWVKKWKLCLNIVPRSFLEPDRTLKGYPLYEVKLVHIQEGQLWFYCSKEGLYLYRLDNNSLVKHNGPPFNGFPKRCCRVLTTSLVSVRQLIHG